MTDFDSVANILPYCVHFLGVYWSYGEIENFLKKKWHLKSKAIVEVFFAQNAHERQFLRITILSLQCCSCDIQRTLAVLHPIFVHVSVLPFFSTCSLRTTQLSLATISPHLLYGRCCFRYRAFLPQKLTVLWPAILWPNTGSYVRTFYLFFDVYCVCV